MVVLDKRRLCAPFNSKPLLYLGFVCEIDYKYFNELLFKVDEMIYIYTHTAVVLTARVMTKVTGQFQSSNAFHFGVAASVGGGSKILTNNLKRKTPNELRLTFRAPDLAMLTLTCFIFYYMLSISGCSGIAP